MRFDRLVSIEDAKHQREKLQTGFVDVNERPNDQTTKRHERKQDGES